MEGNGRQTCVAIDRSRPTGPRTAPQNDGQAHDWAVKRLLGAIAVDFSAAVA